MTLDTLTRNANVRHAQELENRDLEKGALTPGYEADRNKILLQLNEALATELVCALRYRCHFYMTKGIYAHIIANDFMEHSQDELLHADKLAKRIVQLGGRPEFNPNTLTSRSHAEYIEGDSIVDMIKANLTAERIAIDSYRAIIQDIGSSDPTTRRLLEGILETEEEHAEEMADYLKSFFPEPPNPS